MKKINSLIFVVSLLIIVLPYNIYSQFIGVTTPDTSLYPLVSFTFLLFDKNHNPVYDDNITHYKIFENGYESKIKSISCSQNGIYNPISNVVLIDLSASTSSGSSTSITREKEIEIAKLWVNMHYSPPSELGIVGFSDSAKVLCDFNSDIRSIVNSLDTIHDNGSTNMNEAFLNVKQGAVSLAQKGKYPRSILFLTDGQATNNTKYWEIGQALKDNNVKLIILCFNNKIPWDFAQIAKETGGMCYDSILTYNQARTILVDEFLRTQKVNKCKIEWESAGRCEINNVGVDLLYIPDNVTSGAEYIIPQKNVKKLIFNPNVIYCDYSSLSKPLDTSLTIKALNGDFEIKNIIPGKFLSCDKNQFLLKSGDSITVNIRLSTDQKVLKKEFIKFETTECVYQVPIYEGYIHKYEDTSRIKQVFPNSGEKFLCNSDTSIFWKYNNNKTTPVKINFSSDSAKTWKNIYSDVSGLTANWRVDSKTSDKCLMEVVKLKENELYKVGQPIYDFRITMAKTLWSNMCYTPDGKHFVGGLDEFWLYDLENGLPISSYRVEILGPYQPTKFFVNPRYSITAFFGKHNYFWNYDTGLAINISDEEYINKFTWSPDGRFYYYTINGSQIIINDSFTSEIIGTISNSGSYTYNPTPIGWAKDSKSIYFTNSYFSNYNIENKKITKISKISSTGNISAICPDFTKYAEINNKNLYLIDFADPSVPAQTNLDIKGTNLTWNSTGDFIAIEDYNERKINLYNVKKKKMLINRTYNSDGLINRVQFDNLGKFCLIYINNGFQIYNLDSERVETTIQEYSHIEGAEYIWSPDNRTISKFYVDTTNKLCVKSLFINNDNEIKISDISDSTFSIIKPEIKCIDVDMGNCPVGQNKDSIVTGFIFNPSIFKCKIKSIEALDGDKNSFGILKWKNDSFVYANDNIPVTFRFSPSNIGKYLAKLKIVTEYDTVYANLRGTGIAPFLIVTPQIIDFGRVPLGNKKILTDTVCITNIGSFKVKIDNIYFNTNDSDMFALPYSFQSFELDPGESKKVSSEFSAKDIGIKNSQINISYDNVGSPLNAKVTGTCTHGNIGILSDSLFIGEVKNIKVIFEKHNFESVKQKAKFADIKIDLSSNELYPVDKKIIKGGNDKSLILQTNCNFNDAESFCLIPVIAGLGKQDSVDIKISELKFYDKYGDIVDYDFTFYPGKFKILGICREGGARFINSNAKVAIKSISPNPGVNEIIVSLTITEQGNVSLILLNELGEIIRTIPCAGLNLGNESQIKIDVSDIASGTYRLVLNTPTYTEHHTILIIK